jgi:hypothetical protein
MRSAIGALKASVIRAFLDRCGPLAAGIKLYENPTEEIHEARKSGKKISLYARGAGMLSAAGQGARARLEENYLFDTRRFPTFVTGEAFPVALAPGEYLYFGSAVGQPAANNGFSPVTVPVMSDLETNMDTASQIPQGKDYVLTQLGISFNVDITTANASVMIESGAIRFEKQGGQYTLKHGRPNMWPGGTGLGGNVTTAAGGAPLTIDARSNGAPDIRAVRKMAVPRVIRQKETFAYKYVVPRANRNILGAAAANNLTTTGIIMTIWLWGGQQDAIPV